MILHGLEKIFIVKATSVNIVSAKPLRLEAFCEQA